MKPVALVFALACALAVQLGHAFLPASPARPASALRRMSPSAISPVGKYGSSFTSNAVQLAPQVSVMSSHARRTSSVSMGLFGLGAPEIAVCIAVAALIMGPDKLAGMAKDVGKMAGELKDVPKEFQAGIEEGEAKAAVSKGQAPKEIEDAAPAADAVVVEEAVSKEAEP
ncbi:unnamed protein product [Discosporangium mesarthrocarpum]